MRTEIRMRNYYHTEERELLLTRRDLAERWRVSGETLKRREKAGLLKALKIGRGIRYRWTDILGYEKDAELAR
jgi:hypothetical protein